MKRSLPQNEGGFADHLTGGPLTAAAQQAVALPACEMTRAPYVTLATRSQQQARREEQVRSQASSGLRTGRPAGRDFSRGIRAVRRSRMALTACEMESGRREHRSHGPGLNEAAWRIKGVVVRRASIAARGLDRC